MLRENESRDPLQVASELEEIKKARKKRTSSSSLQSPLETYLREINETALLNAQEEKDLARAIAKGDVRARDRMVRANLCDWWSTSLGAIPARGSAYRT